MLQHHNNPMYKLARLPIISTSWLVPKRCMKVSYTYIFSRKLSPWNITVLWRVSGPFKILLSFPRRFTGEHSSFLIVVSFWSICNPFMFERVLPHDMYSSCFLITFFSKQLFAPTHLFSPLVTEFTHRYTISTLQRDVIQELEQHIPCSIYPCTACIGNMLLQTVLQSVISSPVSDLHFPFLFRWNCIMPGASSFSVLTDAEELELFDGDLYLLASVKTYDGTGTILTLSLRTECSSLSRSFLNAIGRCLYSWHVSAQTPMTYLFA